MRSSTRLAFRAMAIATFVLASLSAIAAHPAAASPTAAAGRDGVPAFSHVFLIVGENTARSQLTTKSAPYITTTLKPSSAWVNSYYSFKVDGSLANYIGMTSGQYVRCDVNNFLPAKCHQNVNNVFHQLDRHHIGWKQWTESATGPCDFFDSGTGWNFNIYGAHHVPAIYYDNIEGGIYSEAKPPKAECIHNVVPTGTTAPNDTSAMDHALAAGTVPRFNMIIPNDCEQGHDKCGTHNRFGQFDAFVRREVPKIEASPAFDANSAILITYDEGADPPLKHRFNVMLTASGPLVNPGIYRGGHFNHYSLLRAIEDGFRLPLLKGAKKAVALKGIWK